MKVLIFGHDKNFASGLKDFLAKKFEVHTAHSPEDVKENIIYETYDVIISEIKDANEKDAGIDLLKIMRASEIEIPLILMASHSGLSLAVNCMKSGASDFIEKSDNDKQTYKLILNAIEILNIKDKSGTKKTNKPSKKEYSLLLVDDDKFFTKSIELQLKKKYNIDVTNDFLKTLDLLYKKNYDLVLMDIKDEINNNEREGIDQLMNIMEALEAQSVIMLSGWANTATAVECLKLGASDFIEKSANAAETIKRIETALQNFLKTEDTSKEDIANEARYRIIDIAGEFSKIQHVRNEILRIAEHDVPVLIYGETGTGKEMVASAIHRACSRKNHRFVCLNCGSIPDSIFESEIFGYKKGAFTGATSNRVGKMEAAHKGTLFLDEIENLNLDQQAKLLRVLEDKKIYPLGCNEGKSVDFRLICAANIDLQTMVNEEKFREDLYYRLNLYYIELPPLRERGVEEIHLLIKHFLRGMGNFTIEDDALKLLRTYTWPGNVRELRNMLRKFAIIVHDCDRNLITYDIVKEGFKKTKNTTKLKQMIKEMLEYNNGQIASVIRVIEDTALLDAYEEFNGNISRISEKLFKENPRDKRDHRNKVRSIIERNKDKLEEKL